MKIVVSTGILVIVTRFLTIILSAAVTST